MLAAAYCLVSLCLIMGGSHEALSAPAPQPDWQERYIVDRELAAELYGLLQNYLMENGPVGPMMPVGRPAAKRNSEIINSLLALPKGMAEVGRR